MPEGYSWVRHTTSESAAQGIRGAWLARAGFLAFGLAVIRLAAGLRGSWARGAVWLHLSFGVLMVATAAFSHKPWLPGIAFDPFEDALHSFTATAMGFSFAFGLLARFCQRARGDRASRWRDTVALAAATVIPPLMFYQPVLAGLLQRSMFLVAYAWYGSEAFLAGPTPTPARADAAGTAAGQGIAGPAPRRQAGPGTG